MTFAAYGDAIYVMSQVTAPPVSIDAQLAELLRRGEHNQAAEGILAHYGAGVFRMLMGVLRDRSSAEEAFQHFSVQLWSSLPSFRGRSSLYTWTYAIARRSASHELRRPNRRRERRLTTTQEAALPSRAWTYHPTEPWLRTDTKKRFHSLCRDLPAEERLLVMLRIGQRMSWREIAEVQATPEEVDDAIALRRAAAKWRKRFERIKGKLRLALLAP
jgi:RNA polymerase sigma-70 factor (ECF subfamily)